MPELALTPQLFAIFSSLIEESCGIHYESHDRALLGSKLAAQAADAGFDSLLDYYYRLRYDDPSGVERRALVQALVVHETYFFRERTALEALVDLHLRRVIRERGRARVWCAACSTGEEPLTVAMLLDQRGLLGDVELIASDISETAIARARSGRFGRRSLREGYPEDIARRYLETGPGGIAVTPRLLDAVRFRTLNLLDDAGVRSLGTFDAVLCRNVLIYFRDAQIIQVIERLGRALAPDGLLAVGVSESLLRFGTTFTCEEHGGAFFYRSVST